MFVLSTRRIVSIKSGPMFSSLSGRTDENHRCSPSFTRVRNHRPSLLGRVGDRATNSDRQHACVFACPLRRHRFIIKTYSNTQSYLSFFTRGRQRSTALDHRKRRAFPLAGANDATPRRVVALIRYVRNNKTRDSRPGGICRVRAYTSGYRFSIKPNRLPRYHYYSSCPETAPLPIGWRYPRVVRFFLSRETTNGRGQGDRSRLKIKIPVLLWTARTSAFSKSSSRRTTDANGQGGGWMLYSDAYRFIINGHAGGEFSP